jgi:hypothetical protein
MNVISGLTVEMNPATLASSIPLFSILPGPRTLDMGSVVVSFQPQKMAIRFIVRYGGTVIDKAELGVIDIKDTLLDVLSTEGADIEGGGTP